MKVARRCRRALVALPFGPAARLTGQANVPRNHLNQATPVNPPDARLSGKERKKGPHQRCPLTPRKHRSVPHDHCYAAREVPAPRSGV